MATNENIELLNEVLEGLHFGQVVEFEYGNSKYSLESYQLKGDNYHSLCLYRFEEGNRQGVLVFADKISYFGEGDYPHKFEDNYPIRELKEILKKEKVFNNKNFFESFEDGEIEIVFID